MSTTKRELNPRPGRRGTEAQSRRPTPTDDIEDLGLEPAGELGLIVRALARRVGAETALLAVRDHDRENLAVLAGWGAVWGRDGLPLGSLADGFVGRVLSTERAAAEPLDPDRDRSLGIAVSGSRLSWAAGAAVMPPGGPPGALCAGFSNGTTLDPERVLWLLDAYARLASLCMHEAGILNELVASARLDGLTGCMDYAAIRSELDREIGRSARHRLALSCCFIDLDGFKRVNDRHGHQHGNLVLAGVASVLREGVRIGDSIGRYGGDEFVAILPATDASAASVLAERLRLMVSAVALRDSRVPLDASVGIAQWQPGTTTDELLAEADEALLNAKRAGGGTVLTTAGLTGVDAAAASLNQGRDSGHRRDAVARARRDSRSPGHG
jgi:diguanylate cyclase (GGDEF)-like protein